VTEEQGLLQHAVGELSSALANAVGASSLIQHRLLKGEFRERRVIAGLRPFIPLRYEMSSGVIVNADGNFSRQQDIILSDSMLTPPFLAAGELGVHPIEAVAAVIEVKSVATAQAMREAVENIASVKRLAPDEPRGFTEIRGASIGMGETGDKPFGGALFLGSGASDEAMLDAYLDATGTLAPNDRPNAVVVVGEFTLVWGSFAEGSDQPSIEPQPSRGTHVLLQRLGVNALLAFYMSMMKVLAAYQPPELDLIAYVNNSGGLGDHEIVVQKLPTVLQGDGCLGVYMGVDLHGGA
jgi:hypothetical protein